MTPVLEVVRVNTMSFTTFTMFTTTTMSSTMKGVRDKGRGIPGRHGRRSKGMWNGEMEQLL